MNTLINYLKYSLSKKNVFESYLKMREDYISSKSDIINTTSKVNGIINPKYAIRQSNGVLGALSNVDVKKIVEDIKINGYHIFPNLLSAEIVADLRKFAENTPINHLTLLADNQIDYSPNKLAYNQSKNLSNRHQFLDISVFNSNENLLKLIFDENFLHIANEYLDTKPVADIITMWWSNSLDKIEDAYKETFKSAAAQMYHFDMDRLRFIKFFVYLTDVDTNTGPHVYVKKTHNRLPEYIKSDGRYTDALINEHSKNDVVEICGKAGSIIAVDTRGLHKGKELVSGERLIFQIEFTNSLFGKPDDFQSQKKLSYPVNKKYSKSYQLFLNN